MTVTLSTTQSIVLMFFIGVAAASVACAIVWFIIALPRIRVRRWHKKMLKARKKAKLKLPKEVK